LSLSFERFNMKFLFSFALFVVIGSINCGYLPKFFKKVGEYSLIESFNVVRATQSSELWTNKTYFLSELKLNWNDASLTCRSYGMSLWFFNTRGEWDNMQNVYNNHRSEIERLTWIGGTKLASDDWYWVHSGESIWPSNFDWAINEPSNGVDEKCSNIMIQHGKVRMNDAPCNGQDQMKFLCVDVKESN
jgi:hypothetical protein